MKRLPALSCAWRRSIFVLIVFPLCVAPFYVMPAYSLGPLNVNDEPASLAIFLIGKSERFERIKREYMSRLSAGGKALLLANRRDYSEAMEQLKRCPRPDSASADYVRAFCLEGLGQHQQAIASYKKALSKVDLTFNPSSMFYLHFAIAYFESGDYRNCQKYLNIAFAKARAENRGKTKRRSSVVFVCQRLTPVVSERSGQYKEALAGYASLFSDVDNPDLTKNPFPANASAKEKARLWLEENVHAAPKGSKDPKDPKARRDALAFLVKLGEASFAIENYAAAKEALLKAVALEKQPLFVNDKRFGNQKILLDWIGKGVAIAPLGVVKAAREAPIRERDKVNAMLVYMYVREKDYLGACKMLRRNLLIEPWNVHQIFAHVIRMRDVPQVVTQSDVDIHSEELEVRMETSPILQFAPIRSREIDRAYERDMSGPLLDEAGDLAQQGKFRECLPVMDKLIAQKKHLPAPANLAEFQARYQLGNLYLYAVELLRIGVAFAGVSNDAVLSFANFGRMDNKSRRIWQPVEDQLLGRPAHIGEVDEETRAVFPRMIAYEHFAAGVHSMKIGNYKDAAKQFFRVYSCPPAQKDAAYSLFAKALEAHCKSR